MVCSKKIVTLSRLLLLLCLTTALCGCYHKNSANTAALDNSARAQDPASLFAESLAMQAQGTSQYYATTPMGEGLVTGGKFYYAASGKQCRMALFTSNTDVISFAICNEEQYGWQVVPTIFEKVAQ